MKKIQREKKRLVILGAGYGGIALAKLLDAHFTVTLIERKDQFFHNVGSLRATVDSSWLPRVFIPYDRLLQYGTFAQGTVTDVTVEEARLETGEPIPFDYLALATGSSYPFPAKVPFTETIHAKKLLMQVSERIRQAERIVLIGAGPVGIEFAGEIASAYRGKNISLIDPRSSLLDRFRPRMGQFLLKDLQSLGVEIILGEAVQNMPEANSVREPLSTVPQKLFTDKGRVLEADLSFVCFGVQPNTEYLRPHFAQSLDEHGFLRVNEYLQVEAHQHIFALGDMTNIEEAKMASAASIQAKVVAENLKRLVQSDDIPTQLRRYTSIQTPMAIIPVGPDLGAAQLPIGNGLVLGAFAASRIKGKGLFVDRYWKELGMILPSHILRPAPFSTRKPFS